MVIFEKESGGFDLWFRKRSKEWFEVVEINWLVIIEIYVVSFKGLRRRGRCRNENEGLGIRDFD